MAEDEAIEDIRDVRDDFSLREVEDVKKVPSSSAMGDWLRRMWEKAGIKGMERVNDRIAEKVLKRGHRKGYTLLLIQPLNQGKEKPR